MNNQKQDISHPENLSANLEAGGQGGVDHSRRKFTGAGLGVSAIFTLASQPVLATGGICKSPSGFASGNLSQHGTSIHCSGRTPGYWGTHPSEWPFPYKPGTCKNIVNGTCKEWKSDGTFFHPLFAGSTFKNADNTSKTLMQVIWLGGNADPHQLGAHIVAALLNAKKGWTPVLNEIKVIGIWNEYVSKGYFEPTAGVQWNAAQIVSYLKSTMPL